MSICDSLKNYKEYINDSFYQNSVYLIISSLTNNASGFFFWVIAALLFSQTDIGLASAIISVCGLCVLFSRFGIDQSLIRFFPEGNKSQIFTTTLIATLVFTLAFGLIYLLGIEVFTPDLAFIKNYALIFLLFLCANLFKQITSVCFIAIRASKHFLIQNLIFCSRILFLIPFAFLNLGPVGIFSAIGIAFILSSLYSLVYLYKFDIRYQQFDLVFLRNSFKFSMSNYLIGISMEAPKYLIPLIILFILGPDDVARYFIPFTFCSIFFAISNATSTQLLVEGSHGESLKKGMRSAIITIFFFQTLAMIFIFFFGQFFLDLLGKGYSDGLNLMLIISVSNYFIGFFSIYYSVKNVQKNFRNLLVVCGIQFLLHISLCWILLVHFGLIGAAYSWLISYIITCGLICCMMYRDGFGK